MAIRLKLVLLRIKLNYFSPVNDLVQFLRTVFLPLSLKEKLNISQP